MSDRNSTWGEVFNLNDELRRIEEEVDRRLEETLASDPHVVERETVHLGAPEDYRMRQSLPTFGNEAAPAAVEEPAPVIEDAPVEEDIPAEEVADEPLPVEEIPEDPETLAAEEEAIEAETQEEIAEAEEPAEEPSDSAAHDEDDAEPEMDPRANISLVVDNTMEDKPADEESDESPAEEVIEAPEEETEEIQEEPAEEPEEVPEEPAAEPVDSAAHDEDDVEPETDPRANISLAVDHTVEKEPTTEEPVEKPKEVYEESVEKVKAPSDNRKRTLAILCACVAVLAVVIGVMSYRSQIGPRRQYETAQSLLAAGDYDGAIEAFTAARGYKDAADQILSAQYAKASALVDAGSYGEAIDYIDGLSNPNETLQNLRASAIYQIAVQDYADGALDTAVKELEQIADYETDGISAANLLNQIRYQQATDALAIYDFDAAGPILQALGDYEDAEALLYQVQNAIDIVYTDVARDDDGKEIKGQTQYLWVHSVITPGSIDANATENEVITSMRGLGNVIDDVDDDAVHVLMMQMATTDAAMEYTDAEPIETDKTTIYTLDVSSYAAVDESFGEDQTVFSPQSLQRSDTDYTFEFAGSEAYAGEDADSTEVRMECKMADDGYWCKTRRVYADMVNGKLVGVPQNQLRTWTKVTSESVADEVRAQLLNASR